LRREYVIEDIKIPTHANANTDATDLASRIEMRPSALTAAELAALVGIGKTAIYDLAKRGGIPHFRIGGSIRFDPAKTAAWLRQHEVATSERRFA